MILFLCMLVCISKLIWDGGFSGGFGRFSLMVTGVLRFMGVEVKGELGLSFSEYELGSEDDCEGKVVVSVILKEAFGEGSLQVEETEGNFEEDM